MFSKKAPQNIQLPPQATPQVAQHEQFQRLLEADKRRLYAYIFAYMSDAAATDDIFQDTCLTLWKEFHRFEIGTQFSKWANGIAFNRIRSYRRKHQHYVLGWSDDFLAEFSQNLANIDQDSHEQEQRWQHLDACTRLLSDSLNTLYQDFYVQNYTAQDIANSTGRSIYAIRKAIHKLRKTLFDCVDEKTKRAV